jgi:hypothetical protein
MYTPGVIPNDPAQLADAIRRELAAVALQLANSDMVILTTLYAAPKRIIEGMIVKADGTTWNPGGGAGVYCRTGGAWVKL